MQGCVILTVSMLVCVSGIFGQKLEETVKYERRYGNKMAPMLVEQCVDFIRQWGLQEEGLFRLPGQANLVKELQDAFDCGEKPSFDWLVAFSRSRTLSSLACEMQRSSSHTIPGNLIPIYPNQIPPINPIGE